MLKKINRVLKLVGLNLVRAKRKGSVKWQKLPTTCAAVADHDKKSATVPLSDYMGDSEWHNTPAPVGCEDHKMTKTENDGITHYVGDGCPGGHGNLLGPVGVAGALGPDDSALSRIEQPNSDNKVTGPTS